MRRRSRDRELMFDFYSFLRERDGYGEASLGLAHALSSLRNDVELIDLSQGGGKHTWDTYRFAPDHFVSERAAVLLATPDFLPLIKAPAVYLCSMFEASRVPPHWIEVINRRTRALIVPCPWNAEIFRAGGIKVPIHVVPLGVDSDTWGYLRRPPRDVFTFLWHGSSDMRKGWDIVYTAFDKVFRGNENVRLILHFRYKPKGVRGFRDKNVRMIHGYLGVPALRAVYARADAYVYPSRGEGWGLPPREAACTGLPVLATNWGGLATDIEKWATPLPVVGRSPAKYGFFEDGKIGDWVEPDPGFVAAWMEDCVRHRQAAMEKGWQASQWLRDNATWEKTASQILELIGVTHVNQN